MNLRVNVELSDEQLRQIAREVDAIQAERQAAAAPSRMNSVEAAEYLACDKDRIHDLVQLRKLPAHRDGRRLVFDRADLDAYLGNGQ